MPFTLLVTAGLWCLLHGLTRCRPSLEGGALLLLASCWIRVIGIPLALASSVGLLLQHRAVSRARVWLNAVALASGALLAGLWLYQHDRVVQSHPFPPASYANTVSKLTQGTFADRLVQPFVHLYHAGRTLSELFTGQRLPKIAALVLFWLPVVAGAVYSLRRRQFLLLFAALGYLGAILLIEVPITRYYLPVASVLFLWFGFGIRAAATWLNKVGLSRAQVPLLTVVVLLLMACNLPKDLRHIYRQQNTDRYASDEDNDLIQIASFLRGEKQRSDDVTFVMETDAPSVAFLSDTGFLNIPKSLAQHALPPDDVHQILLDEKVGYLIFWKNAKDRRAFFDALRSAVATWPEFELVHRQKNYEIFANVSRAQDAGETEPQNMGLQTPSGV